MSDDDMAAIDQVTAMGGEPPRRHDRAQISADTFLGVSMRPMGCRADRIDTHAPRPGVRRINARGKVEAPMSA